MNRKYILLALILILVDGGITAFAATDIPTFASTTHQYNIDWEAVSQGEKAVTLLVDYEGDGIVDKTVTSEKSPNIIFRCISKRWSIDSTIGRTICSNSLLISILITPFKMHNKII